MTEAVRTVDLAANDIHIEIDGLKVARYDLPSGYVPNSFMPLIEKHAIITGDKLQNGMVVIVESRFRENPEKLEPSYRERNPRFIPTARDRRKVQETSRWALVTDFVKNGNIIGFTAIYADGTMVERVGYNQSITWTILKSTTFEAVVELERCFYCGEFHDEEDTTRTVADNETDQMFYDVMDSGANLIGALLFPEASSKAERITRVKEALKEFKLDDFMDGFMEGLEGVFSEEAVAPEAVNDFAKQPGTSIVDDFDQSTFGMSEEERIEAEEARQAAENQRRLDDEALAALRAHLSR